MSKSKSVNAIAECHWEIGRGDIPKFYFYTCFPPKLPANRHACTSTADALRIAWTSLGSSGSMNTSLPHVKKKKKKKRTCVNGLRESVARLHYFP